MEKSNINNLTLNELEQILEAWGEKRFHARQIFLGIYQRQITDFDKFSELSLGLKKRLKEHFDILSLRPVQAFKSIDGTEKFILELPDKNIVEAVIIPTEKRITACISTQVGCKFRCNFCASGILGFKRNLTCAEIIEEIILLKNHIQDKALTHIVFMGTGEPLDNYDNVLKAIRKLNSPSAFNIGARRITISTAGVIPGIERLSGEGLQIELSVSLHFADAKMRSQIMPINKTYSLADLILACRKYIKKTNRQVTFEYILIKDLNSDLQSAEKLGKILKDMNCKVNLIPCNPIGELKIEPPNKAGVLLFKDYLLKHGVNVTLRRPRGEDIDAACGQLRLRHEK